MILLAFVLGVYKPAPKEGVLAVDVFAESQLVDVRDVVSALLSNQRTSGTNLVSRWFSCYATWRFYSSCAIA